MATYGNDLRLKEIATGDEAGTWGTSTNTNLELIGEALSFGTQDCFASDADATTTVADGVADPARSMYFKVTSSATLTATRTLTIAPNTISRVMWVENATTGSQSITISQGSGTTVTIQSGEAKSLYLDGGGTGANVVEFGTVDLEAVTTDILPNTDDNNDLGSSTKRWQDLYLSGGAYLGGTVAANYLDDYEEGTWTPVKSYDPYWSGTVTLLEGLYVKVGRMVTVTMRVEATGTGFSIANGGGPLTGNTIFDGLPFTTTTDMNGTGGTYCTFNGLYGHGTTYGAWYLPGTQHQATTYLNSLTLGNTDGYTYIRATATVTYMTDA